MGEVRIPLRDRFGDVVGEAVIDERDSHLGKQRWCLSNGYAVRKDAGRKVYMHRVILGLGPGDKRFADHINRDRLDNRRSNLRAVTAAENCQNLTPRTEVTSRHRGVHWKSRARRWVAKVTVGGQVQERLFRTEDEAARAVVAMRAESMPFNGDMA